MQTIRIIGGIFSLFQIYCYPSSENVEYITQINESEICKKENALWKLESTKDSNEFVNVLIPLI